MGVVRAGEGSFCFSSFDASDSMLPSLASVERDNCRRAYRLSRNPSVCRGVFRWRKVDARQRGHLASGRADRRRLSSRASAQAGEISGDSAMGLSSLGQIFKPSSSVSPFETACCLRNDASVDSVDRNDLSTAAVPKLDRRPRPSGGRKSVDRTYAPPVGSSGLSVREQAHVKAGQQERPSFVLLLPPQQH